MFHPRKPICCYCNLLYKNPDLATQLRGGQRSSDSTHLLFALNQTLIKMDKGTILKMLMALYLPLCLSTDYVFTEYSSDEAESGYWDLWNPSNETYDNDLDKKYTITVHHYN